MKRYENDCCDCTDQCQGCQLKHNPHWYCDVCGEDFSPNDLFDVNGDWICEDCMKANYSYRDLLEEIYGTVQD